MKAFRVLFGVLALVLFCESAEAYYHPDMGRFISRDPIGYTDGGNLYAAHFVPRDTDPSGTCAAKTCCCCVNELEITDIKKKDTATWWGHKFIAAMKLEYIEWDKPESGDCKLEWFEKTNRPYLSDMKPNKWLELVSSHEEFHDDWNKNRDKPCPGITELNKRDDGPALRKDPGWAAHRTMYFAIRVSSAEGCPCSTQYITVFATQFLTIVNGRGVASWFKLGVPPEELEDLPER